MFGKGLLAAGLLGLAALGAAASAPLMVGAAMLVPALLLAAALWIGWYPGADRLERLALRGRRTRRAPRRGQSWSVPWWRRISFAVPNGHRLGLHLAVRPPPA